MAAGIGSGLCSVCIAFVAPLALLLCRCCMLAQGCVGNLACLGWFARGPDSFHPHMVCLHFVTPAVLPDTLTSAVA